jgi:hypothetical protein
MCLNSSRNLLYVRRPRSFKDCRATGGKEEEWIINVLCDGARGGGGGVTGPSHKPHTGQARFAHLHVSQPELFNISG